MRDPLRGKEEGELWTACGRKEGCGIQKVGVGGGSHHVGAVGKNRPLETEVMVDRRFSFAAAIANSLLPQPILTPPEPQQTTCLNLDLDLTSGDLPAMSAARLSPLFSTPLPVSRKPLSPPHSRSRRHRRTTHPCPGVTHESGSCFCLVHRSSGGASPPPCHERLRRSGKRPLYG